MSSQQEMNFHVAVIGAGPAGLYAAKHLASEGIKVALFNRDIKPGGLAEYGIYPTKHRMKEGLRNQFRQILATPEIDYYGNVAIGQKGDLTLEQLRTLGYHAILVTVGAQGTKWLGLPGEELVGVYHAKDLVYHYNKLPPYSQETFLIGRKLALIGVGNVMVDIAHWAVRALKVDEVIAVARRGPVEVKFDKKEFEAIAKNLDLAAFEQEIGRVTPILNEIGQDLDAAKAFILSALEKAKEPVSKTQFRFDFLASPSRILGDSRGRVCGLEVEDTVLVPRNGDTKAKGLGTKRVLEVDTVVFCIGDRVDEEFGLSVKWNEFAKNPEPGYPIDNLSYEAYDLETESPLEGIFLAGWAREASSGLVGSARKDGVSGAKVLLEYLRTEQPKREVDTSAMLMHLSQQGTRVVTKLDWQRLEEAEKAEAEKRGLEEFKFSDNDAMLAAIGQYELA